MTPFAITGIQMHVAAVQSNVEAMRHRIEIAVARFPWTQMILFSELAPFGPLDHYAQPFPNDVIAQFHCTCLELPRSSFHGGCARTRPRAGRWVKF